MKRINTDLFEQLIKFIEENPERLDMSSYMYIKNSPDSRSISFGDRVKGTPTPNKLPILNTEPISVNERGNEVSRIYEFSGCGTVGCIAGWAVALAKRNSYVVKEIERKLNSGNVFLSELLIIEGEDFAFLNPTTVELQAAQLLRVGKHYEKDVGRKYCPLFRVGRWPPDLQREFFPCHHELYEVIFARNSLSSKGRTEQEIRKELADITVKAIRRYLKDSFRGVRKEKAVC